jgi:hypothetical protein
MSPETKTTLVVVIVAPILFWVSSRLQFKMYEPLFILAILWITLKHAFTPIKRVRTRLMEKMDF